MHLYFAPELNQGLNNANICIPLTLLSSWFPIGGLTLGSRNTRQSTAILVRHSTVQRSLHFLQNE